MYSREHAILSAVVGALAVLALPLPMPAWAAVVAAVVVGVGIDFDHFLVARIVTGEWTAVRRCLRNPRLVFFDQGAIFGADDLTAHQRLLSHHVIGGVVVGGLWLVSEPLALFVAVVLYAHVLSDLAWDTYRFARYEHETADAVSETDSSA